MFCDTEYEAVVKYVSVRWLCLERCLDRELRKYHALKSYFLSELESDNRFKRLNESFQRPMSEICLMFFQSAIALLNYFNRFLQREDPLIYLIHTQMETFLNKLAVTALFTNMRILKFKSQLTIAFFAAVNHLNGPLGKQNFILTGLKGHG